MVRDARFDSRRSVLGLPSARSGCTRNNGADEARTIDPEFLTRCSEDLSRRVPERGAAGAIWGSKFGVSGVLEAAGGGSNIQEGKMSNGIFEHRGLARQVSVAPWVLAHEAVLAVAKERALLDRREGTSLLLAHRERVHQRLGYGAFAEYTDRHLGYCHRTTADKLRTAEALEQLPELARAQQEGRLHASAVRELARVATAGTGSASNRAKPAAPSTFARATATFRSTLKPCCAGRSSGSAHHSRRRKLPHAGVTGERGLRAGR
jgi:hypothetical protein